MLLYCASKPLMLATPASPIAEPRAHGLTNRWEAPADPTRSSFPAKAYKEHAAAKIKLYLLIDFMLSIINY